jgi:hypothetical protein
MSLAEVRRKPQESDAGLGCEPRELSGALRRHAVIDEEHVADMCSHLGDQRRIRRRKMRRDQGGDAGRV